LGGSQERDSGDVGKSSEVPWKIDEPKKGERNLLNLKGKTKDPQPTQLGRKPQKQLSPGKYEGGSITR